MRETEPTLFTHTQTDERLKDTSQESAYWEQRRDIRLPRDPENQLEITINYEKAFEVLDRLMAAYRAQAFPYDQDRVRVPQDPRHMPQTLEYGSTDHAMFLFNSCYYMRGGIKSNRAFVCLSRVYDAHPELFNCETASTIPVEYIEQILTENGLGFQKTVAAQWVENSRRMHELYDGDPRKIFDDVDSYNKSLEKIQNKGKGTGFIGFQEKMTSMIVYYLADAKMMPSSFVFPIPVDLHVMRISIANKLIEFPDAPYGTNLFSTETTRVLRELYSKYAEETETDPVELCNAVWQLSESTCGTHPGNVTIEPLGREVRGGRSTLLVPGEVQPNSQRQREIYAANCAQCPIVETCAYNIPGAPYYILGHLGIRGTRLQFAPPAEQGTLL